MRQLSCAGRRGFTLTARGTYQTAERRRFVAWLVACSLLGLLLLLDLGFISRHVLLVDTQRGLWNLESDAGYPEKFQYLKWLGASVLLLALAVRRRAALYVGWAVIFCYFLVDDATSIHERWGGRFAAELHLDRLQQVYLTWFPGLFLRPQDFGELTVMLIVAAAIVTILVLTWPTPDAIRERIVTKWLIAWLGLFALFAVVADMVHIMVSDPATVFPRAFHWLALAEDGGKMICASLLVGGLAMAFVHFSAVPIFGLRRPQA